MPDLNKHLLLQLHMILWFAYHFSFNKIIEGFELREAGIKHTSIIFYASHI